MFRPLALYIGLRYTRAKRRNQFISFISLVSIVGIALGVGVLITVLSVMNGFDREIKARIYDMVPHITLTGPSGSLSDWQALSGKVKPFKGVLASAPYVNGQGMLTNAEIVHPAIVLGIVPAYQKNVSGLANKMEEGSLSALQPKKFGIVLGQQIANHLALAVGDKVNLMIPQVTVSPIGILPRAKRFTVVGIFHAGAGFGFDNSYAYIHLKDAEALYTMGNRVSGLQLKIDDLFAAPEIASRLQKKLGYAYQISDWSNQYGGFYHAVQMEKTIMFFILLLLIAIAVFNLVSSLMMLVNDKRADIAILRTFGATPNMVLSIFMVQGCFIGIIGTLMGLVGGVILSLNVTRLVDFIQRLFHVQILTSNVYFVNYLPSQLQMGDVINISLAALLMSLMATIYPAWSAARTHPVEALRYE